MAIDGPTKSRLRSRWLPAGAIIAVAVFVAWWAFGRLHETDGPSAQPKAEEDSIPRLVKPARPATSYAGSESCARCHQKICDSYRSHPMAHSFEVASRTALPEDGSVKSSFSKPGSFHYRVERSDDGAFHHESKTDAGGATIYDQRVPVRFAVGSGTRARSFVIDRGGLLFESPITWYSGRKEWDLSPGYLVGRHPRFDRRITDACLGCHAGRPNPDPGQLYRFQEPVVLEAAIGCERCHGPGRAHIAFHDGLQKQHERPDPIVNPVKLSPRKRDAVCYQCHLHGEERVLRYGRGEFDFRPGMELEDVWAVFVRGGRVGPDGRTQIVSQVEQMRQSVCYRKSNGRMGCISCHDPHGTPSGKRRDSFYRQKCNRCHSGPGKAECSRPLVERNVPAVRNACVQCHMPRLPASNVPHTSQTDHRVLRDPRRQPAAAKRDARLTIFDNAADRLPKIAVDRAYAIFTIHELKRRPRRARARDAQKMLLKVLQAAPNDVASLRAAGAAAVMLGRPNEARKHWTRALELQPKNERVLVDLVALEHKSGNLRAGLAYVDRLIELNPWRADFYGRKAHMLGQLRQFESGVEAAKKALALNPSLPGIHAWLSQTYRLQGNEEKSRYHEGMRKRLTPTR